MNVLERQYVAAHPDLMNSNPGITMRVVQLKNHLVSGASLMLWTLFGAVGFVLCIACANVASLLLARAASRTHELAVRAALGAGRMRLVRQLLAESLLLSIAGGCLGVLLANWTLHVITHGAPNLQRGAEIRLDSSVLAFSVTVSIVTGVLFGLLPSLRASRPALIDELRVSGAAINRETARKSLGLHSRDLLVTAQIALSIVLLIGAALLLRSFVRLHSVDPGFQPANLLTAKIALPPARYDTNEKRLAFFGELLARARDIPGVRAATIAMSLPTTTWIHTNYWVEGKLSPDILEPSANAVVESVIPGYFETLRVPLKRGHEFTAHDNTPGAPPVMMFYSQKASDRLPSTITGIEGKRIQCHQLTTRSNSR
jgi:predicted permease